MLSRLPNRDLEVPVQFNVVQNTIKPEPSGCGTTLWFIVPFYRTRRAGNAYAK